MQCGINLLTLPPVVHDSITMLLPSSVVWYFPSSGLSTPSHQACLPPPGPFGQRDTALHLRLPCPPGWAPDGSSRGAGLASMLFTSGQLDWCSFSLSKMTSPSTYKQDCEKLQLGKKINRKELYLYGWIEAIKQVKYATYCDPITVY